MHRVTRRRLSGLLALLCAAEVALAAAAWRAGGPPADRPAPHGSADTGAATPPLAAAFETVPVESFRAMVERPLFLATRRPPPAAPAGADGGMANATANGVIFGPYRFTGIVVTPRVRIAFVTEMKTGRSLALGEGEKLGDWRCAEIRPGRVTLERAGRREVIELNAGR